MTKGAPKYIVTHTVYQYVNCYTSTTFYTKKANAMRDYNWAIKNEMIPVHIAKIIPSTPKKLVKTGMKRSKEQ